MSEEPPTSDLYTEQQLIFGEQNTNETTTSCETSSNSTQRFTVTIPESAIQVPVATWNAFIGDLVPEATPEDVKKAYSVCGPIHRVNLITERGTGLCKGYGFIHFLTEAALRKAISPEFCRLPIRGVPCKVKVAEDKLVLYVGNIPQELTEDEVRSAIKQICTKITNEFNIEFRPCPGEEKKFGNRGFCFLVFTNHELADACRKLLTVCSINNRTLSVSWADSVLRPDDDPETVLRTTTLYISNLSTTATEAQLREIFGKFGEIVKCSIIKNHLTGQSRGFAFIQFTTRDATLDAMRAMDGAEINGQRISVVLAKPPPGRPRGDWRGSWGRPPRGYYDYPEYHPRSRGGYYGYGRGYSDYYSRDYDYYGGGGSSSSSSSSDYGYADPYRGYAGYPNYNDYYRGSGGGSTLTHPLHPPHPPPSSGSLPSVTSVSPAAVPHPPHPPPSVHPPTDYYDDYYRGGGGGGGGGSGSGSGGGGSSRFRPY